MKESLDRLIAGQRAYLNHRPIMKEDHTTGKLISRAHDELREAHQASEEDLPEELADVVLEVLNIVIYCGIQNFDEVILGKIQKNRERFPMGEMQEGNFAEKYDFIKHREREQKGYAVYPLVNPLKGS